MPSIPPSRRRRDEPVECTLSRLSPRDTIDSIDTSRGVGAGKGGFVNCVNCVKGGIGAEKAPEPLPPPLPAPTADEIEALAATLLAEAERCPAQTITAHGKALTYFRAEAMRRLDLIRQRAIDATSGEDIVRQAIMAEETAPMAALEAHKRAVAGLTLVASPLPGCLVRWPAGAAGAVSGAHRHGRGRRRPISVGTARGR